VTLGGAPRSPLPGRSPPRPSGAAAFLTAALAAAHNLTATLHAATPALLSGTPSSPDRQTQTYDG